MIERAWHYYENSIQEGPVTESQLRMLIARGSVSKQSLVWCSELGDDWMSAEEVEAFRHTNISPTHPPLPTLPPVPSSNSAGRIASTVPTQSMYAKAHAGAPWNPSSGVPPPVPLKVPQPQLRTNVPAVYAKMPPPPSLPRPTYQALPPLPSSRVNPASQPTARKIVKRRSRKLATAGLCCSLLSWASVLAFPSVMGYSLEHTDPAMLWLLSPVVLSVLGVIFGHIRLASSSKEGSVSKRAVLSLIMGYPIMLIGLVVVAASISPDSDPAATKSALPQVVEAPK